MIADMVVLELGDMVLLDLDRSVTADGAGEARPVRLQRGREARRPQRGVREAGRRRSGARPPSLADGRSRGRAGARCERTTSRPGPRFATCAPASAARWSSSPRPTTWGWRLRPLHRASARRRVVLGACGSRRDAGRPGRLGDAARRGRASRVRRRHGRRRRSRSRPASSRGRSASPRAATRVRRSSSASCTAGTGGSRAGSSGW